MKYSIPLFVVFFLFMSPMVLSAQDDLKQLLDEDTVCVVHVDLAQIDIDAVFDNNQKQLEPILKILDIKFGDKYRETVRSGKIFLTDALGIEELYLVVRLGGNTFPVLGYIAIPKTESLNTSMISTMLEACNRSMQTNHLLGESDAYCFITTNPINRGLFSEEGLNQKNQEVIKSFLERRPKDRPEFLEAREVVKDYPIQVLFALPKYVKKVFKELRPTLPEPFEYVDLAVLLNGIRWKAVGIDAAKPELLAVGEAESELDAQMIYLRGHELFSKLSAELLEFLKNYTEDSEYAKKIKRKMEGFEYLETLTLAYPDIINEENLKRLENELIPKPEGKRFTVQWDAATFQAILIELRLTLIEIIGENVKILRHNARSIQLVNQLKQIGLGMHNYYDKNNCFPPTYSVDKDGKPLHSWRVLILPYMEDKALYDSIRLDEPWDSDYNRQFHDKMPEVYCNPMYPESDKNRNTNFCEVVGPETFGKPDGKSVKLSDMKDGTSNTIMVIERKTPVCWMAPIDISQENAYLGINKSPEGIGGLDRDGTVGVLLGDGSVQRLNETLSLKTLKALLGIADGQTVSLE